MFKFQNVVASNGYKWADDLLLVPGLAGDGSKGKPPFLIPDGERGRVIFPLEDYPTLFEEFALLKNTSFTEFQNNVQRFANNYGFLGLKSMLYKPNETDNAEIGEGLNIWQEEVADMNIAYRLWQCIRKNKVGELSRFIHWENNNIVGLTWDAVGSFKNFDDITGKTKYSAIAVGHDVVLPPNDLIAAASYFLQKLLNGKLTGHISPRVVRDQEFNLYPYFVPDSLISVMWFQLFQAVTGIKTFIQCDICGGLIEINKSSRSTKTVHTRCSKNRSDKKRKAKNLYKDGLSSAEIADQVNEELNIVEEWLIEFDNDIKK